MKQSEAKKNSKLNLFEVFKKKVLKLCFPQIEKTLYEEKRVQSFKN